MKNPRILLSVLGVGILLAAAGVLSSTLWSEEASDAPVVEITWNDLVPEGFTPNDPFATMSQEDVDKLLDGSEESNRELARLEELMAYAPTDPDMDNMRVKLPGYVVPLDFDGNTTLSEFLLVPYYGACIHTPPPPANQVVHANALSPVEIGNGYDPVWAIGTLRNKSTRSDLAEAGYHLKIEEVLPYSAP